MSTTPTTTNAAAAAMQSLVKMSRCAHKSSRHHGVDDLGYYAECIDCGERLRAGLVVLPAVVTGEGIQ